MIVRLGWTFPLLVIGIALAAIGRADGPPVTAGHVEDAIERAVAWLKQQRNPAGHWEPVGSEGDKFRGGDTALATLALLYAGEDPRSEGLTRALQFLAGQPMAATYTRGLRAHVLALTPGETYRGQLTDDVAWLQRAMIPPGTHTSGGYGYDSAEGQPGGWCDNSNSQFAVLGLWMASEAGINIPFETWTTLRDYWTRAQNKDGGWPYQFNGNSTGSMTAAGLASLYVVLDRGYANDEGRFNGKSAPFCGQHREAAGLIRAIGAGLDWFGANYTPDNPHGDGRWKHYYLYGVERTGRASGQKYFRGHDWFREGAAELLATQADAGYWPSGGSEISDLRATCFGLMFLCHGRAPLLYNKLQHRGDWDTKLRDVAGLTRYAQGTLERFFNWQVVELGSPLEEWLEAPVLYVTGHEALQLNEVEGTKLREYCDRGGLIFAVACCSRTEFSESIRTLAGRLFPEYALRPVPPSHPILSGAVQHAVSDPPALLEVHNGRRTLLLLSTQDVCAAWNQGLTRPWKNHFQLGVNVYLYATDKTPIRTRLETADIPLETVDIRRTVHVARIRHAGDWNIEPYGWTRLSRYLNNRIATRLLVTSGIPFDAPVLEDIRVAHITGSGAFELTPEELAGLRRFLTGGGTLIADAAGGAPEFTAALEKHVRSALKVEPIVAPDDAAVFTGEGLEDAVRLSTFGYRRTARRDAASGRAPRLKAFELSNRLAVIYSPFDVSMGLLGTPIYECRGLDADTCLRLMRNLLLYADLSTAQKARTGVSGGRK